MFSQLYTINKMQQAEDNKERRHDLEKPEEDAAHIERVVSHTTTSDPEKLSTDAVNIAVANGPIVHEKVGAHLVHGIVVKKYTYHSSVQREALHDPAMHVFPMDRLPNPTVSLRLGPSPDLSRHRRC